MKCLDKKQLCKAVEVSLNLILIFGIFMTITVYYNTFFRDVKNLELNTCIVATLLTIGIVCIFLIVFQLKKIMITLTKGNPFVWENVKSLNKISIECFIIAACYLGNFIANLGKDTYRFIYIDSKGIHTDTELIIFIFAGIFILILSKVFKEAIKYKEENDFTI
ncbi:DUF2975 domain-containing protein [Hathewaya limosa]|uniref:DUF2975 domain-containing protein n=1 Tax=Hathewaya limosa TaxID=1536 RepID=A0ABU0JS55_HATLI|nr:DUF2975 domain-containing protein [Hathewaya limosa]AWZ48534.1 DUF2975 domain-containing protein [Clostridiaceae bacterium 14S0207]MDQ0478767.1 hypothetical protein [Hathewaya limosa]